MGVQYVSSLDVTPEELAAKLGNIDLVYEASGASQAAFELTPALGTNAA
jgi:hypothetical protein